MALMRKSNREFMEEVFSRSENRISKKKAFQKKVLLSAVCLVLMLFIVPMQSMLESARGGSSEMNDVVPNEQEWKDTIDDSNGVNSMDQIRQESNSFSQSEKKETCDQESSEQMATGLTCDTETESEDTETAITGEVLFDMEEDKDE